MDAAVEEGAEHGLGPGSRWDRAPGEQYAAVFTDLLVEGTYVVATDGGITIPFAVIALVDLDVPDIFASPEA